MTNSVHKAEDVTEVSGDVSRFSRPTLVPHGRKFHAGNGGFDAFAQFVVAFVYRSLTRGLSSENAKEATTNRHDQTFEQHQPTQ